MEYPLKPIDATGKPLAKGDKVFFTKAPETLINGLPEEDQQAIKAQEGIPMEIVDFDQYGHVEMEFTVLDEETHKRMHTIWVAPNELFKK